MKVTSFISVFLAIFYLSSTTLLGQPEGYRVFKGKLEYEDGRGGVPNIGVGISGSEATVTNYDGTFHFFIPDDQYEFIIDVQSSNYSITVPKEGKVDVKANPDHVERIKVKSISAEESTKKIALLRKQVDQLKADTLRLFNENLILRNQVDNLTTTLIETTNEMTRQLVQKEEQLAEAKEEIAKLEKQLEELKGTLYDEISVNLTAFKDDILNLKHCLEETPELFTNFEYLKFFNQTITKLNISRDQLHQLHYSWERQVEALGDTELSRDLSYIYRIALDTYSKHIIPLNEFYMPELNKAWGGKGSRMAAQRRANKYAQKVIPFLESDLEPFMDHVYEIIEALERNRMY